MCCIAIKYFKDYGWCAAKNRDRPYKPYIKIKKSLRDDLERCLFWDAPDPDNKHGKYTYWTEGINEYGIGILSTTLMCKKDEKEGDEVTSSKKYSIHGKFIRTALLEKTVKDAVDKLIELEIEGHVAVFDEKEAYLIEAPMIGDDKYLYHIEKLDKDKYYVRTNHGIKWEEAGYPKTTDEADLKEKRKSSEHRYQYVYDYIKSNDIELPRDLFKALSVTPDKNPQYNPIRLSKTHDGHIVVTTGQILISSKNRTLHYRPIWSKLSLDTDKINGLDSKTFFEIISTSDLATNKKLKKSDESLMTFKEFINIS